MDNLDESLQYTIMTFMLNSAYLIDDFPDLYVVTITYTGGNLVHKIITKPYQGEGVFVILDEVDPIPNTSQDSVSYTGFLLGKKIANLPLAGMSRRSEIKNILTIDDDYVIDHLEQLERLTFNITVTDNKVSIVGPGTKTIEVFPNDSQDTYLKGLRALNYHVNINFNLTVNGTKHIISDWSPLNTPRKQPLLIGPGGDNNSTANNLQSINSGDSGLTIKKNRAISSSSSSSSEDTVKELVENIIDEVESKFGLKQTYPEEDK